MFEWNDLSGGPLKGYRGGSWNFSDRSSSADRVDGIYLGSGTASSWIGFRLARPSIAAVPEIDASSFGTALSYFLGGLAPLDRRRFRAG